MKKVWGFKGPVLELWCYQNHVCCVMVICQVWLAVTQGWTWSLTNADGQFLDLLVYEFSEVFSNECHQNWWVSQLPYLAEFASRCQRGQSLYVPWGKAQYDAVLDCLTNLTPAQRKPSQFHLKPPVLRTEREEELSNEPVFMKIRN